MKKYIVIFAALLLLVSCESKQDKQLKVLKAIAERTEIPKYDPFDIGTKDVAPTHARLRILLDEKWTEGEIEYVRLNVAININSGYADIRAISLVIDYDETCATLLPFDKSTIHPALSEALSTKPGAMMSNINNGKFYFAFYCLAPMELITSGLDYSLLSLTFTGVQSPAFVKFDTTPGNVDFSMDGYNSLILELEDYEL